MFGQNNIMAANISDYKNKISKIDKFGWTHFTIFKDKAFKKQAWIQKVSCIHGV